MYAIGTQTTKGRCMRKPYSEIEIKVREMLESKFSILRRHNDKIKAGRSIKLVAHFREADEFSIDWRKTKCVAGECITGQSGLDDYRKKLDSFCDDAEQSLAYIVDDLSILFGSKHKFKFKVFGYNADCYIRFILPSK